MHKSHVKLGVIQIFSVCAFKCHLLRSPRRVPKPPEAIGEVDVPDDEAGGEPDRFGRPLRVGKNLASAGLTATLAAVVATAAGGVLSLPDRRMPTGRLSHGAGIRRTERQR
jgi:hypothetical protein